MDVSAAEGAPGGPVSGPSPTRDGSALLTALRDDARVLGARSGGVGRPLDLSATDRYGQAALIAAVGADTRPARAEAVEHGRPPGARTHYRDLVGLEGTAFVTAAFRHLLRRAPDADGLAHYLAALAAGRSKTDILREIIESTEGRWKSAALEGLPVQVRIFRRPVELPPIFAPLAARLAHTKAPPFGTPAPSAALAPPDAAGRSPEPALPAEIRALRIEVERLAAIVALLARDRALPSTSADPDAHMAGSICTVERQLDRKAGRLCVRAALCNAGAAAWLPRSMAPMSGVALGARRGMPGGPGFAEARNGLELPDIVPSGGVVTVTGVLELPNAEDEARAGADRWVLDLVWNGGWLGAQEVGPGAASDELTGARHASLLQSGDGGFAGTARPLP